ncbi:hypothetical protein [Streptomyces sp. NPDC001153]
MSSAAQPFSSAGGTPIGKHAHAEIARYPDEEFTPPYGGLLLLLEHGEPVAGGAFRHYDATTAELKRIWTHSAHRRIRLTTGPRRPEARGLHLATGYTPLFDTEADPESTGPLPFEKHLPAEAPAARTGKAADR